MVAAVASGAFTALQPRQHSHPALPTEGLLPARRAEPEDPSGHTAATSAASGTPSKVPQRLLTGESQFCTREVTGNNGSFG